MSKIISVEYLSKVYRLGQIGTGTFTNDLKVWWANKRGRPNPLNKIGEAEHGNRDGEDVWALRNISFDVNQGDVLGIIGRNGAGKSTLLKILSRITAPTSGQVKIKGRIASLLEVGTGFHPDLTGRENIYLNGSILGMTQKEVGYKLDEIVTFAGVEQYIDTPVKRYSSGMYVRLAFAVAAHLEPEILVVDEVLAVGDAEFQNKCIGKMNDISKEGRTVLFVSHNMGVISRLTETCIWLDRGRLVKVGPTETIIRNYLRQEVGLEKFKDSNGYLKLLNVEVTSDDKSYPLHFGQPFTLSSSWYANKSFREISFFGRVEAEDGAIVATINSVDSNRKVNIVEGEQLEITWKSNSNPLLPGKYFITLAIHDKKGTPIEIYWNAISLKITNINGVERYNRRSSSAGYVYINGIWEIRKKGNINGQNLF